MAQLPNIGAGWAAVPGMAQACSGRDRPCRVPAHLAVVPFRPLPVIIGRVCGVFTLMIRGIGTCAAEGSLTRIGHDPHRGRCVDHGHMVVGRSPITAIRP